jgi:hypothetical protein
VKLLLGSLRVAYCEGVGCCTCCVLFVLKVLNDVHCALSVLCVKRELLMMSDAFIFRLLCRIL